MSDAVIVIPWRDKGDLWRRANLDTVLAHLNHADVATVHLVSDGRGGPFNRSAAYNRGMAEHPADVWVFHEADMIIPAAQLERAVEAASSPGLVVPFDTYHYLTPEDTETVHHGADPFGREPRRVVAGGRSTGAVNVVSAETMTAVGRWDEQFQGWGWDDRAMTRAFHIATGAPARCVPGVGVHLWHPPGGSVNGGIRIPETEQRATDANKARYQRYLLAETPSEARALTCG